MGDEGLYLKATNEVKGDSQDPALWAKAMAIAEGDQDKAKYQYIKLRVEQLAKSKPDVQKEYGFYEGKAERAEWFVDIEKTSGIIRSEGRKEDARKHDPSASETPTERWGPTRRTIRKDCVRRPRRGMPLRSTDSACSTRAAMVCLRMTWLHMLGTA